MGIPSFEYKINKISSKIGFTTDVIFPLIIVVLLTIFIITEKADYLANYGENGLGLYKTYAYGAALSIGILIAWITWRLLPWPKPFWVSWSDQGINFESPWRAQQQIQWNQVSTFSIEGGQKFDILKKIIPVIYLGNYSWNAILLSVSSGHYWLADKNGFVHFQTKDNQHILIPVPYEYLERASQLLATNLQLKESSLAPQKSKKTILWWVGLMFALSVILPILYGFTLPEGSTGLIIFQLILFLTMGLSGGVFLYLAYLAFFKKRTIIGGITVTGAWAYIVGFIWLALGITFIYVWGGLSFLF